MYFINKRMKRIAGFILLMMMGIVSVHAQWTITPEAGMAITKRNAFQTGWEGRPKIGVGLEYQFPSEFFALRTGLYYMQRGYSTDNGYTYYPSPYGYYGGYGYGYGAIGGYAHNGALGNSNDPGYMYANRLKRHMLQVPVMADFSFRIAEDVRLHVAAGPYVAVSMSDRGEVYVSGYYPYADPGYGASGEAPAAGTDVPLVNPATGLRAFDWGLSGVLGLEVKQWMFNFGYDLSLGKEYKHGSVGVNYHTVSLSLGYKFKLGK